MEISEIWNFNYSATSNRRTRARIYLKNALLKLLAGKGNFRNFRNWISLPQMINRNDQIHRANINRIFVAFIKRGISRNLIILLRMVNPRKQECIIKLFGYKIFQIVLFLLRKTNPRNATLTEEHVAQISVCKETFQTFQNRAVTRNKSKAGTRKICCPQISACLNRRVSSRRQRKGDIRKFNILYEGRESWYRRVCNVAPQKGPLCRCNACSDRVIKCARDASAWRNGSSRCPGPDKKCSEIAFRQRLWNLQSGCASSVSPSFRSFLRCVTWSAMLMGSMIGQMCISLSKFVFLWEGGGEEMFHFRTMKIFTCSFDLSLVLIGL